MRKTGVRTTVFGLMIVIAGAALVMGTVRFSRRWADDWAFDRREAARHRHEADSFYPKVFQGIRDHRAQHPKDDGKIWVVHGVGYRVTPEFERYIQAMIDHHRHQAERHEWAVRRRWAYVSAEPSPTPPPVVPIEEVARAYGLKVDR